ncbi:MAG: metallopeptidase [Planctomycetes bacterium]|nr:metallopeptidase [Planctomycetota bacterium]
MTQRITGALVCMLLIASFVFAAKDDRTADGPPHNDPIGSYEVMQVEGWTLRVSHRYVDHADDKKRVLDEIAAQLRRITLVMQPAPLAQMRKTEIWVEYDYPWRGQYHPKDNAKWLVDHGYIPEKAGTIEVASAKNLMEWAGSPVMMILHELTHSYHDKVLGFNDPRIIKLYEQAKASGKFDKVIRDSGREEKHYGLTTPQEYFAEMSEAYLWVNDYYPFVYGELKEADPDMAKLLHEIWGDRRH